MEKMVGLKGVSSSKQEVDAVHNPTELFHRINSLDWKGALDTLQRNPNDARVWIRKNSDGNGLAWKYLPLHLICLQFKPPRELLLALLQCYPQASSHTTPHDGNLPIHYVCESGCEDERVFAALLASFPQSLEVKNAKGKTPLLMCHPQSRGVLMRVLRQRKPGPHQKQDMRRDKERRNKRSNRSERRNDANTFSKEKSPKDTRQPPRSPGAKHRHADTGELGVEDTKKTPKMSNNTAQLAPSFFGGSPLGGNASELAISALNYLGTLASHGTEAESRDDTSVDARIGSLTRENAAQQRTIDELNRKLHSLTTESSSSNGVLSAEDPKLCERIMAKAEADNVAFRTQIQELQNRLEEMKIAADKEENDHGQFMGRMRKIVNDKAMQLNIDVFGDESSCRSDQSSSHVEQKLLEGGLRTLLSHMDERNSNLNANVLQLEDDLAKSDVALKMSNEKQKLLQADKDSMTKSNRALERKITIMDEEKCMSQTALKSLKDRASTLTVINQSLQEQVESISSGQVQKDNEELKEELKSLRVQVSQLQKEKASVEQVHLDNERAKEMEKQVQALLDKNRSLKDTILTNNEKYFKKVQELGEQYSSLEAANRKLREKSDSAQSNMLVRLENSNGEKKFLYEV